MYTPRAALHGEICLCDALTGLLCVHKLVYLFEINNLNIFQNNNEFELTVLNPTLLEVKGISLYDINGKQVFNYSNLELQNKYSFSTKSLSDGVYVASLDLGNAKVITKKVIVKN